MARKSAVANTEAKSVGFVFNGSNQFMFSSVPCCASLCICIHCTITRMVGVGAVGKITAVSVEMSKSRSNCEVSSADTLRDVLQ